MIVINQDTIQVLFALVRSVITGKQLTEQECALYNQEMLPKLMAISKNTILLIWSPQVLMQMDLLPMKLRK